MLINNKGNKISKNMLMLALSDRFLKDNLIECSFCGSKDCHKIKYFERTYICQYCYEKYQRDIIALQSLKRSQNE